MPNKLPSWYVPEQPVNTGAAPSAPLPDWYEPEAVTVTAEKPDNMAGDMLANAATGVARVPGAIGGLPHLAGHTVNWTHAQFNNALNWLFGRPERQTGADLDAQDPVMKALPSAQDIDKRVFQGISALAGRNVQPYEPDSFFGKLGQAAITGGLGGVLDPLAAAGAMGRGATLTKALTEGSSRRAAQTALAADAATATQDAFPDSPGLAAAAAIAAHGGSGAGVRLANKGYKTFLEPVVNPRKAGEVAAGRALVGADHTQPGMASPTRGEITAAEDATRSAVDDIGGGMDDYTAGGAIREGLQARKDALRAGRNVIADKAYDAFRAEDPMPVERLGGFLNRPSFRRAMRDAGSSVLDEGARPLTEFWSVENAGAANPENAPGIQIKVPALPPDVLDRIKGQLDDTVGAARPGSRAQRTAKILRDDFVGLLDEHYPNTYPKTRADYADASRPLDPLETGPSGRVLDSTMSFGNRIYSMPQDKVAATFLKSQALRSDFDNLIAGFGGDKTKALDALEQNLASKVAGAVNGDGTLSLDAFNRAVRPHAKALSMWFPQLSQKFSTAEAAQKTLDTLRTQKTLSDDLTQGALRGNDDVVTRGSANRWLSQNEVALQKTQAPAALARLRQIANALDEHPGGGAEAAIEAAPMAVGGAFGGLEGGVLGGITHKIPGYLAAPRLKAYRDTYSTAIEKAFTDPAEAKRLVDTAAKRGGSKAIRQILKEEALRAAMAAPIAVNAGAPQ
jgi:hypothetical protein